MKKERTMKDKVKVFIEKDALESLILNEKTFRNLVSIIGDHSELFLNMSKEDINKEWQAASLDGQRGGSKIQKFCTGKSMKRPTSAKEEFVKIVENNQYLLNYSRSIFIMDISPEKAESIRDSYGVMVLSKSDLSDDVFQFQIHDSVDKDEIKEDYDDGWEFFFNLRNKPWLPSNVLVISDEYLFKNDTRDRWDGNINFGVRNLKSIIPKLLPESLDITYQILIVSPIPKNNKEKAKDISDKIINFVHSLPLLYKREITLVFTDAVHPRKAFSNYYVMTADKGFSVFFYRPKNKVREENILDITSNFFSAGDSKGTNGYDVTTKCLKELKESIFKAQERLRANPKDPSVFIAGDCGPKFEIYNRLMEVISPEISIR